MRSSGVQAEFSRKSSFSSCCDRWQCNGNVWINHDDTQGWREAGGDANIDPSQWGRKAFDGLIEN